MGGQEQSKKAVPEALAPDTEMILAALTEAVFVVDVEGSLCFVNQAAESMLGRSRRSLLGARAALVFEGADWLTELLLRMNTRTSSTVETKPGTSDSALRADGPLGTDRGERHIIAVATPVRDREGMPDGLALVLQDPARHYRLAGNTEGPELDQLVAQMAHEVNNPLSGIRGAAQLLGRKLGEQPQLAELAEYTDMIVRQVDRMSDLVTALLQLEAPKPKMRPVNIHRVLNEVMLLEHSTAAAKRVALKHEFDPSLPEVFGNPSQLQQLFLNVVKNAIEACPTDGGAVHLTTRMETNFYIETGTERRRYIAVDVNDNGGGMDEETASKVFNPFFTSHGNGHGLGLTIARNISLGHNGNIEVDGRAGKGARFTVHLPVAELRESA